MATKRIKAQAAPTFVRSMTVPVDRVVVGYKTNFPDKHDDPTSSDSYRQFRIACSTSWQRCAQACNWWLFRLAGLDTAPLGTNAKGGQCLPPLEYDLNAMRRECRLLFPDLDSQSLYALDTVVIPQYKRDRFAIRIRGEMSLRSYRSPQPLPLVKGNSELSLDLQGRVLLKTRISGEQFMLRLKDDPKRFGRQLSPIRRVIAGELARGGAVIRDGRDRQTLISIPVTMPVEPTKLTDAYFIVSTDAKCLLVGQLNGRREFLLTEGQLRRWQAIAMGDETLVACQDLVNLKRLIVGQGNFVQQMGEDRKAERRGQVGYTAEETRRVRQQHSRNLQRALETRCEKHHRRVTNAIHKIACMVVNHATRRRTGTIVYDDTERSFLPWFPYYRMKELIVQKAELKGIKVISKEDQAPACV